VVIAHRLSTIKDADKIVVVKNGLLVEEGTNDELLEKYPDGVYASFCAKQATAEAQKGDIVEDEQEVDEVTRRI